MSKIIIILLFLKTLTMGCAFPSLQGAFRNNQTIFIAQIIKEVKIDGRSTVYIKNVRSLNGELFKIDSIEINSYNGKFSNYDEIIFSPKGSCGDDQISLFFDWAEVWRVKKGIIVNSVYWGGGKMSVVELLKHISEWKNMGECVKC